MARILYKDVIKNVFLFFPCFPSLDFASKINKNISKMSFTVRNKNGCSPKFFEILRGWTNVCNPTKVCKEIVIQDVIQMHQADCQ